jgi:hypothetical protein
MRNITHVGHAFQEKQYDKKQTLAPNILKILLSKQD